MASTVLDQRHQASKVAVARAHPERREEIGGSRAGLRRDRRTGAGTLGIPARGGQRLLHRAGARLQVEHPVWNSSPESTSSGAAPHRRGRASATGRAPRSGHAIEIRISAEDRLATTIRGGSSSARPAIPASASTPSTCSTIRRSTTPDRSWSCGTPIGQQRSSGAAPLGDSDRRQRDQRRLLDVDARCAAGGRRA